MKFDDLDARMRIFETAGDRCVLPGLYMVARLDGRGFTRLAREAQKFEAPFDARMRDLMVATTRSLMECGFNVRFGYTQSDEISLLFALEESAFGRKTRKFDSLLAAQASVTFSMNLGAAATFDCRICELPGVERVRDYFRWRSEDALRNALNSYCYWTLRKEGRSVAAATRATEGLSVSAKNELLFSRGINFKNVPAWQKRGTGLWWENYERTGTNPKTGATVTSMRRRIATEPELPVRDGLAELVTRLASD